jgi:hypothetical protein
MILKKIKIFLSEMLDKCNLMGLLYKSGKNETDEMTEEEEDEMMDKKMQLRQEAIFAVENDLGFETVEYLFYVKEAFVGESKQYFVMSYDKHLHETFCTSHSPIFSEDQAICRAMSIASQYVESDHITKRIASLN